PQHLVAERREERAGEGEAHEADAGLRRRGRGRRARQGGRGGGPPTEAERDQPDGEVEARGDRARSPQAETRDERKAGGDGAEDGAERVHRVEPAGAAPHRVAVRDGGAAEERQRR